MLLVRDRLRREWNYPGGYVDAGESALAACVREVAEEVGIGVTPDRFQLVGARRWQRPLGELTFTTFALTISQQEAKSVKLQAFELTDYRWTTHQEALQLVAPRLRDRLQELLVSGSFAPR